MAQSACGTARWPGFNSPDAMESLRTTLNDGDVVAMTVGFNSPDAMESLRTRAQIVLKVRISCFNSPDAMESLRTRLDLSTMPFI